MTGIRPIVHLMALAWWRWARDNLSQHQPLHADLPYVMRRVAELEMAR
jgi:hypothetical protein